MYAATTLQWCACSNGCTKEGSAYPSHTNKLNVSVFGLQAPSVAAKSATQKSSKRRVIVRSPRFSLHWRLIDYTPANNSRQDFGFANAMRVDFEDILRDDNEIGKFASLDRTFRLFTPSGMGGAKCVTANRLLDSQPLLRNEASFRLAFRCLTRHRGLNAF